MATCMRIWVVITSLSSQRDERLFYMDALPEMVPYIYFPGVILGGFYEEKRGSTGCGSKSAGS